MPLAPAVALGGLHVHAVMIAGDVGEGLQAQRPGVILIGAPGAELDGLDRLVDSGIAAEGEARPFFGDLPRAQIWIPGKPAEAIQVGLRQVT